MAAGLKYKEYTFPSTDAVSLTTILGLTREGYLSTITVRAGADNASSVVWGASNVTASTNRGGYLAKGEAVSIDLLSKWFSTDQLYFQGAQNDKLHITTAE